MSKKIFSFINPGEVRLQPGTKIIPAESVATVLSAHEVQDSIKRDAEIYRQTVTEEIEELKAKAQLDGYQDGFAEWIDHIAKLEDTIIQVRKDYEKILVPVALRAVKKLFGRELENNEKAIVDIVATSLKSVSSHKKITLYVSPKEKGIIESNKSRLKELFEQLEVFQIRERADIEPGGAVIETEVGIINAKVANQWQVLESAFQKILKQKSETST